MDSVLDKIQELYNVGETHKAIKYQRRLDKIDNERDITEILQLKKEIDSLLQEYKNINININKIKMDGTTTDSTRIIDLLTARFDAVETILLEINAGISLLLEKETKEPQEEALQPSEAIMTADEIIKKINSII